MLGSRPSNPTPARAHSGTKGLVLLALAAGLIATLPFLRGLAQGRVLYFRDLSRYFFPTRHFLTEGLLRGELRLWNPYVHEGFSELPLGFYPPDLLQLLRNDAWMYSVELALHVALAAVAMFALLRALGAAGTSSLGAGVAYALSGYGLSLVNLDIALRAYAWMPLIVLTTRRAAVGSRRHQAIAALTCAVGASTLSPEILLQAAGLAIVLSCWPVEWPRIKRLLVVGLLALGLASTPLLLQMRLIPGSARATLLDTGAVLSDSIPPVALLQLAVANLFGDLSNIGAAWWGSRFFGGVPYILSLYVGATTIALAAAGLAAGCWFRRRLLLIVVLGLAFCMGDALGVGRVVDWLPVARVFRYPVKLFASVQFVLALSAGYGLHALSSGARQAWLTFLAATGGLGIALTVPLAAWLGGSAPLRARLDEFIGDAIAVGHRQAAASFVLWDAASGGALALTAGLLGVLVLARRLRPALGAGLVCVVMTMDLVRAGAGLNPMVTPDFDTPSPETAPLYASISRQGGRVFTCDVVAHEEYYDARRARGDRGDTYVFAAFIESATPHTNLRAGLATALSADLFSLVPVERTGSADELTCHSLETMEPRLRMAGVTHVVSVKALSHPWLRPLATVYPRRLAPLGLRVYALVDPLPLLEVAESVATAGSPEEARRLVAQPRFQRPGAVVVEAPTGPFAAPGDVRLIARGPGWFSLRTEARADTVLIVREGFDSGWAATVNGAAAPIWRANARHLGLPIPAGVAEVSLRHRPWQLGLGALLGGFSGLLVLGMLVRRP